MFVQVHAVLPGQLPYDVEIPVPVRAGKGDGETEAGGQAHQLLPGVAFVDVIAGAVRYGLLDEMAAVAGGVDRDILGPAAYAALQNGLQGGEVIVVGGEAEIVDEKDEFQGIGGQGIHQIGDLVELILLDLHQPQALGSKVVGDGLDGAGFAGAGVAVEQHIVGGLAVQQGLGVGDDLLPLLFVAWELFQLLGVRVLHRHQLAVFHGEHVVTGENAVALGTDLPHPLTVVLGDGAALRPPALQKSGGIIQPGGEVHQSDMGEPVQKGQLPVQALLLQGCYRAEGPVPDADVFTFHHGAAEIVCPAVPLLEQAEHEFAAVGGEGVRVIPAAVLKQLPEHGHSLVP